MSRAAGVWALPKYGPTTAHYGPLRWTRVDSTRSRIPSPSAALQRKSACLLGLPPQPERVRFPPPFEV
jgi:hypothetical protein